MYCIYSIISAIDGRIYVGMSKDPHKRLLEHNSGETKSTKGFRPWTLFFIETDFQSLSQARDREKILKSGFGKEFLKTLPKDKITYRSGVAQR
jgi:putative endonuclease